MKQAGKRIMYFIMVIALMLTITGCGSKKTNVSLLTDETITTGFSGYNGSGKITVSFNHKNVEAYDSKNLELADFLYFVDISYTPSENLSNGDIVTITASYSESTADSLNLKIVDDTYSVIVSGLIDLYKTAEEVPQEIVDKVKETVADQVEEDFEDTNHIKYSYSYDSMYFAYTADGGLFQSEDYKAIVVLELIMKERMRQIVMWF